MSGETVTITGHVGLLTEEVWGDGCGNFYIANSYWGDPSGATVTLDPSGQRTTVGSDGFFSFTYTLPVGTHPGQMTFNIYAHYSSYSDRTAVTITVRVPPLTITLTVSPTSGDVPFSPNIRYTVSGGVPQYRVTITFGDGTHVDTAPGETFTGPTYAKPGTYMITATVVDALGSTAHDAQPVEATVHLNVTPSCPSSVYGGDTVALSATVTASDNSNPQISYHWSASPGAGSSSPVGGTFDDPNSPTPKWTAPNVNAQMDYTIYVDVSASGYISGTGNCKFQLSPPPNYTWVILIPAISIIAGGGYYYNKKRKRAPPPPPKPPKKKDECDDCFIFRLSPGEWRAKTVGPGYASAGWQEAFSMEMDWPGVHDRPVSFRVVGGEEVGATIGVIGFNVQFGPHLGFQLDVNGQNAPADDYYITVTADGTSKTGRPCHGEQTVMLHVCGKVICDDGPFFMEEPDVTGDVERTDSAGNTEKLTGSSRPFGPGDRVQTFSDGFFEQSFEHFLAKGYGGGKVGEAAFAGSGTAFGPNTAANWIDPLSKAPVPWLRMPEAEQLAKMVAGGLAAELGAIIGLEAGKMLLNWKEADKNMTATVLLPRSPAADHGWAARVNGTRLLVEATRDGNAAAITVLDDYGKGSEVEVWNITDPRKTFTVKGGEQNPHRGRKSEPTGQSEHRHEPRRGSLWSSSKVVETESGHRQVSSLSHISAARTRARNGRRRLPGASNRARA